MSSEMSFKASASVWGIGAGVGSGISVRAFLEGVRRSSLREEADRSFFPVELSRTGGEAGAAVAERLMVSMVLECGSDVS
jgi:hypothetical protein